MHVCLSGWCVGSRVAPTIFGLCTPVFVNETMNYSSRLDESANHIVYPFCIFCCMLNARKENVFVYHFPFFAKENFLVKKFRILMLGKNKTEFQSCQEGSGDKTWNLHRMDGSSKNRQSYLAAFQSIIHSSVFTILSTQQVIISTINALSTSNNKHNKRTLNKQH